MSLPLAIFLISVGLSFQFIRAAAASECVLEGDEAVRVTDIVDGDTLVLDDGREVRLTGIQAPKLPLGRSGFKTWPLAPAARDVLAEIAAGKRATLRYGGERIDRHGRVLAQVFAEQSDGKTLWAQEEMLKRGLARVYTFDDNRACSDALLEAERDARAAKRGIWANDFYAIRSASDIEGLAERIGRYELVEGKVVSSALVRDRLYINFGEDYREDFTVTVQGRNVKLFREEEPWASLVFGKAEDAEVSGLAGMRIRVRGWLDRYNGPEIEITHPEQIEVLGGAE